MLPVLALVAVELAGTELNTFAFDHVGATAARAAADTVMTSEGHAADCALTFEDGPHPDVGRHVKPIGHLLRLRVA